MSKFAGLNGYPQLFIREFLYFSAICTNQMVVCVFSESFFILCKLASQLMLYNQFAFQQQVEGVVDRCKTYTIIILHDIVHYVGIEVSVIGENMFQNSISFRGFTMMMLFEIVGENLFYDFV